MKVVRTENVKPAFKSDAKTREDSSETIFFLSPILSGNKECTIRIIV
jgi:hypothetical protein